nr:hypothetical protein [Pseudodesulfovibrio tunisiensis]
MEHEADSPTLRVGGGFEFMHKAGPVPEPASLSALAKALNFMKYDLGLLAEAETDALRDAGIGLDGAWHSAEDHPFTTVVLPSGKRIGFLRYPELRGDDEVPSSALLKKVRFQVREHRSKVDLLIGMSDWGWIGEREYLAGSSDDMPHILLGSGRGSGVNGRLNNAGNCIWVRPYDKGRTVSEIRVSALPGPNPDFKWNNLDTVSVKAVGLRDNIADNPEVSAILP